MNKKIMIQGTASSVGKSIVVAALCRIFKQDGYKTAPFKSQNMALNSFVTKKGHEMGRAQVVQAQAAQIEPDMIMNPILIKPSSDQKAQIILEGKVFQNMNAMEYHHFKTNARTIICQCYQKLAEKYEIIVIEGAGSPAEINLREKDIVNMGMAELVDAPVILVADIDKGGVFASIVGTIFLLKPDEKKRVKGVIINKFRGDLDILKPGLDELEKMIGIPVLGVIPYMKLNIDDEDSVTESFYQKNEQGSIKIEIVHLPHISNFTDFEILKHYSDVNVKYVLPGQQITNADILIIPGTKNTIQDLIYLKNQKLDQQIIRLAQAGKIIIGICGGLQMLGHKIIDPLHSETHINSISGLGLLELETEIKPYKTTIQKQSQIINERGFFKGLKNQLLKGYEIHMGITKVKKNVIPITSDQSTLINDSGHILGSYLHGLFDNNHFTNQLLNSIRQKKGSRQITESINKKNILEKEFDQLAAVVRKHLDLDLIYKFLN